MDDVLKLVTGLFVAVAGLLGLYMAAHAVDDGIYLFGLLLAVFAVTFDFWLLKRHYDAAEV